MRIPPATHRVTLLLAISVACAACANTGSQAPRSAATEAISTTAAVRNKLVGVWQYQEKGVTVEVTYTPTMVSMPGVPPTPYTLNGNEITVDVLGSKTSVVEFRGNDEMTQTNKSDGQRYVFKRKRTA